MTSTFALPVPAGHTVRIPRVPAVFVAVAAVIALLVAGAVVARPLPPAVGAPVASHTSLETSITTAQAPG